MDDYYIYIYLDPRKYGKYLYGDIILDYEPFYVGKGKKRRLTDHITKSQLKRDKNKIKVNKILSIRKDNNEPIILKLFENLEENECLKKEKEIITLIGRKDLKTGPLTNLTNGGENKYCKFEDLNEETKNRLRLQRSINMKQNNPMKNKEICQKVAQKNTNIKHNEEYKKNMSNSLKNSIKHKFATSTTEFRDKKRKEQEKNMIPVNQYDLNEKFIKSYPSISEASRQLKIPVWGISYVLAGKQKTTKKYIFKKC